MSNAILQANVAPVTRLLADVLVLAVVKPGSANASASATDLVNIGEAFIATNEGDAVAQSAALNAITAGITDPARKDAVMTGIAIASNLIGMMRNLSSVTVTGTALTSLLNSFWQQVVTLAQGYQAPATTPSAPAATKAA